VVQDGPPFAGLIVIDGDFRDWTDIGLIDFAPDPQINPNVDIVRFAVVDNPRYVSFLVEVRGSILAGAPSPGLTMDSFFIFIDTDRNPLTGYRVDGLGADRMLEISGRGGAVNSSSLYSWDVDYDPFDWRGWTRTALGFAAAGGTRLETQVPKLSLDVDEGPVFATLHGQGFEGAVDTTDIALNSDGPSLVVFQTPVVPEVIAEANSQLVQLEVAAFGGQARLTGLTVTLTGSATVTSVSRMRLVDANGTLVDERIPVDRRVSFQFPEIRVTSEASRKFLVLADPVALDGETVGALVASPGDIVAQEAVVTLRRNASVRDVGYLGSIPGGPRIDGGFAEWTTVLPDEQGDVEGWPNPNIDLEGFAARSLGDESFFLIEVGGRLLAGTWVPVANGVAPVTRTSEVDSDRDGVPNVVDVYPFDFNNDGIPDSETNGDVDGDGVVDYGQTGGTDFWLNTTIPATFPDPHAGKEVRVYIGPVERPFRSRDDVLRVFVDLDNRSLSGYAVGGLGADRMVEVSGTTGRVRTAGLYAFAGSYPGQWSWQQLSNLTIAMSLERMEFATAANLTAGGSLYVEIGEALGSRDAWDMDVPGMQAAPQRAPSEAFDTASSSFEVAPSPVSTAASLAAPAPDPQGSTLLDASSNSISTLYNHQRKVVRAGDVVGDAACDATNSDGCWYAVFYDQLGEAATAGPNYTGGVGTNGFTNPGNAVGPEETFCADTYGTAWSGFWNSFGFSIPSDATIAGIMVEIKQGWDSDPPLANSLGVTIGKSESALAVQKTGGAQTETPTCGASMPIDTYGGATDLWGLAWAPADINSASFTVRIYNVDGTEFGVFVNWIRVSVYYTENWDRVVAMRSSDVSGATWGSQVILASGRSADNPLLYPYDSSEPSIAIDASGFLHVAWVSASATGNQGTLNLVRYTKTTIAYPTESELASAANWESVTAVDDANLGFMPSVSTDSSGNPHIAWSESKTSGTVYYKNKAGGMWKATVSWGTTYTGLSVDVSPATDYVSLVRYYEAATNEIQYTVCKDLSTSSCDAASEFTKWDGTAGVDTVATGVESASYPSLATTYDVDGDLWVAYAKDVDGTTRAIYVRFLDYPTGGWVAAETIDSLSGTIFTRPSIGVDRNNDVHAMYVATVGPQLYYNVRTGASWGSRSAVGTASDNPTLVVRAPNDATYSAVGGLYWKTSTSETYFFIPEFGEVLVPLLAILSVAILARRRRERREDWGRAPP
jgi:hypothetical protein